MIRLIIPVRGSRLRACVFASLCCARAAFAQGAAPAAPVPQIAAASTEPGTGRALFERAKGLFEAGKLTEACPLFAESNRVEPDTRVLLALATCHREQGKYASAAAQFTKGRELAQNAGDRALKDYAEQALRELPRPSTVHVEVAPPVAAIHGLELTIDGEPLPRAAWNTSRQLDGGSHTIAASAPDRKPWRHDFQLQAQAEDGRVKVETLAQLPTSVGPAGDNEPEESQSAWTGQQWAGAIVGGAGVLAIVGGTAAWLGSTGDDMKKVGAVLMLGGGGAFVAGGLLFWFGGDEQAPPPGEVAVGIGVPSDGGLSLNVRGAF